MTLYSAIFATALGACAIAWSERGIVRGFLPEPSEEAARSLLRRRLSGATEVKPPEAVAAAIEDIKALLAGRAVDLSHIALDWAGVSDFNRRVYEIARAIPPGETLSYGEIAARLDDPALARDVGQAMGENPFPPIVPCHRVVAAGSKLGGFSARGGSDTKRKLLAIEAVHEKGTLFSKG